MISIPRNRGVGNRVVYVTNKASVQSAGSTVCLPEKLREFAQMYDLNLKVKLDSNCPLKVESMSEGAKSKMVRKPGLQLFTKRYKSNNPTKFNFPISSLSDRFKRDNTIILRRPWEKKTNCTTKKGIKVISKFNGFQDERKFQGKADILKNRILTRHRNNQKQKNKDEIKLLLHNDLRHKLNHNRIKISPKYNEILKSKRVLTERTTNYSEMSNCITKTISNNFFCGEKNLNLTDKDFEENLSMDFDISSSQQNHLKNAYKFDEFNDSQNSDSNVNVGLNSEDSHVFPVQSEVQGKADTLKKRMVICPSYKNNAKQHNIDKTKIMRDGLGHEQITYPAISNHITKAISNYFEEKVHMSCESSLPQQDDHKKLMSFTRTIIEENQKNYQGAQTITGMFTSSSVKDMSIQNSEVSVASPTEVNNHVTKDLVFDREKCLIKSENNSRTYENQSDTSEDEDSNQHPNRRLQGERNTSNNNEYVANQKCPRPKVTFNYAIPIKTEQLKDSLKAIKASEMWEDILRTPDLWRVEDLFDEMEDASSCEETIDYHGMLESFVFDDLEEKLRSESSNLYEKRFLEKLESPDFKNLLSNFYIPPAQVEVFYQSLTDDKTAQECLSTVCEARNWPQPEYIQLRQLGGFKFSCLLMERKFVPMKSASNITLAKELAASQCLDWLGIVQRKTQIDSSDNGFSKDTLFD
uniref:Uncharacterized protein n=1 Tax=Graphocephala atropunctata TaxID=36148 RepID=A0A1B6KNB9_9HEMI